MIRFQPVSVAKVQTPTSHYPISFPKLQSVHCGRNALLVSKNNHHIKSWQCRKNFTSSAFACYKLSSIEESRADHIASRCVSFQLFELYAGDTIDELASAH